MPYSLLISLTDLPCSLSSNICRLNSFVYCFRFITLFPVLLYNPLYFYPYSLSQILYQIQRTFDLIVRFLLGTYSKKSYSPSIEALCFYPFIKHIIVNDKSKTIQSLGRKMAERLFLPFILLLLICPKFFLPFYILLAENYAWKRVSSSPPIASFGEIFFTSPLVRP